MNPAENFNVDDITGFLSPWNDTQEESRFFPTSTAPAPNPRLDPLISLLSTLVDSQIKKQEEMLKIHREQNELIREFISVYKELNQKTPRNKKQKAV